MNTVTFEGGHQSTSTVHDSWQNVDMVRLPALDSNGDGKLSGYELGLRGR
jgi:hypothetical protein